MLFMSWGSPVDCNVVITNKTPDLFSKPSGMHSDLKQNPPVSSSSTLISVKQNKERLYTNQERITYLACIYTAYLIHIKYTLYLYKVQLQPYISKTLQVPLNNLPRSPSRPSPSPIRSNPSRALLPRPAPQSPNLRLNIQTALRPPNLRHLRPTVQIPTSTSTSTSLCFCQPFLPAHPLPLSKVPIRTTR